MQCSEQFLHRVFKQESLSSPYLQAPFNTPACRYGQRGPLIVSTFAAEFSSFYYLCINVQPKYLILLLKCKSYINQFPPHKQKPEDKLFTQQAFSPSKQMSVGSFQHSAILSSVWCMDRAATPYYTNLVSHCVFPMTKKAAVLYASMYCKQVLPKWWHVSALYDVRQLYVLGYSAVWDPLCRDNSDLVQSQVLSLSGSATVAKSNEL